MNYFCILPFSLKPWGKVYSWAFCLWSWDKTLGYQEGQSNLSWGLRKARQSPWVTLLMRFYSKSGEICFSGHLLLKGGKLSIFTTAPINFIKKSCFLSKPTAEIGVHGCGWMLHWPTLPMTPLTSSIKTTSSLYQRLQTPICCTSQWKAFGQFSIKQSLIEAGGHFNDGPQVTNHAESMPYSVLYYHLFF